MIVGIFSDIHLPFEHPNYYRFIRETFKKWNVDTIVCAGDMFDNHYISYHETSPDGESAESEYKNARKLAEKYYKAFPTVKFCVGNHDKLPERRLKSAGLPKRMLVPNYYNMPKGWDVKESHVIDGVLYTHGTGSSGGITAPRMLAMKKGMSVVIGHYHSHAGVQTSPTPKEYRFGMCVGCGIDIGAYGMEYAKDFPDRPTIGCGIVVDGLEAYFVPMSKKYWRGKSI